MKGNPAKNHFFDIDSVSASIIALNKAFGSSLKSPPCSLSKSSELRSTKVRRRRFRQFGICKGRVAEKHIRDTPVIKVAEGYDLEDKVFNADIIDGSFSFSLIFYNSLKTCFILHASFQ